jgi:hypothetical protein
VRSKSVSGPACTAIANRPAGSSATSTPERGAGAPVATGTYATTSPASSSKNALLYVAPPGPVIRRPAAAAYRAGKLTWHHGPMSAWFTWSAIAKTRAAGRSR